MLQLLLKLLWLLFFTFSLVLYQPFVFLYTSHSVYSYILLSSFILLILLLPRYCWLVSLYQSLVLISDSCLLQCCLVYWPVLCLFCWRNPIGSSSYFLRLSEEWIFHLILKQSKPYIEQMILMVMPATWYALVFIVPGCILHPSTIFYTFCT